MPGANVLGTLDVGELEPFTVSATAGQPLTIRFSETTSSSLAPGFSLYRPSGAVEATRSSSTSATCFFTPSQSGTYTLVAYDATPDASGAFQPAVSSP